MIKDLEGRTKNLLGTISFWG